MKYTVGCIGCGNMGGALVRAVSKVLDKGTVAICDHHPEKMKILANECGAVVTDAIDIAKNAKFVMIGVKPQAFFETLHTVQAALWENPDAIIVSMVTAISIESIKPYCPCVIRIMPNTPVSLGEGVIEFACDGISEEDKAEFCRLFAKAGLVDEIPEGKINAASALSGCGPAFVYLFAEALADGAVACGLPREKAIRYAAQTLVGAGKMIEEYGHLGDLKDAVCSPGGTTIQGIRALEAGGLRSAVMEAVIAAYEKTVELER